MAEISRRGLFGLFGGVAAAPLVKALPEAPVPVWMPSSTYARYAGFEALDLPPLGEYMQPFRSQFVELDDDDA